MIGFLLYAVTAAFVLLGNLLLSLTLYSVPGGLRSAVWGAALLLVAAPLNFWKRRVSAGVALSGAIPTWYACWFVSYVGLHSGAAFAMAAIFIIFPMLLVVCTPLALTTLYAFLTVTALNREMELPKWLFPDDRTVEPIRSVKTNRQLPLPVRLAAIFMYTWWGILAAYTVSKFRPAPLEFGLPTWILEVVILAFMFWIVVEVTNGKRWARIALLALFALGIRSVLRAFAVSPRHGIEFNLVWISFALQAAALILVFSKASAAYFQQPRISGESSRN